jgi:hypothetical protein
MRLSVYCVRCGGNDGRLEAVDEALAYHRGHGEEPLVRESNVGYSVWDVCQDCCEELETIDWSELDELPF